MNAILDKFQQRSVPQKVGILVGSAVIILGAMWMYLYKPKYDDYRAKVDNVEKLTLQIAQEKKIARNLSKIQDEVKDLDVKLKFALAELPDKKEIPSLLEAISNLARDAGLDVALFKPLNESPRDFYAEVPVSVSVDGTYHQVATFFDEVGRLPRIVNLQQIVLKEPKISEEKVSLRADCLATTFRYLDDEERAKMRSSDQGPASKKKRKGK